MRNEVKNLCSLRQPFPLHYRGAYWVVVHCKAVIEVGPFLRRHAANHADDGFCFHDSFLPISQSTVSDVQVPSKPGWCINIFSSRNGANSYQPV